MKFTLSWLKDHLDTSARLDELCATMTSIGLEVEEVKNPGDSLKDFVVGEILDAKPHPDADKLQCCKVSDGAQTLDIVCGAPNARKGLKVVLAREGVHIPAANFTIKKTKIRGAESCGMLCSVEELGIGEASDGILELPEDAKAGTPIVDVLGLDDPIIEIAITPDRGDCLGVRGIARDLAAAGMGMLKPLVVEDEQGNYPAKMTVSIEVEEDCPQFIGCEIKNVKNGPSPVWMQRRLMAIGLRPISALVDITNYISYNLGRPLHVYDMEKLDGGIVVRHAKDGETLEALNGKTYTLSEGMTVIADQKKVLGLGGIIGGEESGCVDETNDVFLEVALFNPINIAQTGRKLQIDSDARYRFERSVDPAGVAAGVEIAIRMITQLCGGEVSELVVAGHTPKWKRSIPFRPARVAELGGVEVSLEKMRHIFKHLGMQFEENGESWNVTPPSWRPDVEGEADLVEEVVRIFGYDNIPATPLPPVPEQHKPELRFLEKLSGFTKRTLASRGFAECRTWSFMRDDKAKLFAKHDPALAIANPISSDLNYMRPSLLPNLIEAAGRNKARGFANLGLFEVGSQFENRTPEGQRHVAAGIRTGETAPKSAHKEARNVDAYDAKADALSVLAAAGMDTSKVQVRAEAPDYYHPGRAGTLSLGPKIILGYFGELHPLALQTLDYKGHVAAFEVFLDAVPTPKAKSASRPALQASDYQAVERDFAFIANDNVAAGDIIRAIRASDNKLIREVRIFDIYKGKGMEDGKQSVAVSVTLQAADHTLTDEEIDSVAKKIVENAGKQFGGVLRG